MMEPPASETASPDPTSYPDLLTSIVQRFVRLVGAPTALNVARRVPGLTVDQQGRVLSYNQADPLGTIKQLLDAYGEVFGDSVSLPPQVARTVASVAPDRSRSPTDVTPLRLMIVDDHVLFRSGLVRLLGAQPDIRLIGEAGTMRDAIALAHNARPDLILMDISLPDGTGLEATQAILAELPDTQIVFLTVHDDDDHLFAAIRAGGVGYLPKNVGASELVSRLRDVRRGEAAISPAIARRILDEFSRLPAPRFNAAENVELTARELEIVRMLARGASNRDIAERLVISENTVKNHVQNVLNKLHLHSRRDVKDYARTRGLVPPSNDSSS